MVSSHLQLHHSAVPGRTGELALIVEDSRRVLVRMVSLDLRHQEKEVIEREVGCLRDWDISAVGTMIRLGLRVAAFIIINSL